MSEAVRRWRSDEINRKDEQEKKILGEVQSFGRNVGMKTMKKYNIDYAEINVRREMGGWERLRMYQVPTTGVRFAQLGLHLRLHHLRNAIGGKKIIK